MNFLFRFRVNRPSVLTPAQYASARALFLTTVPSFFPVESSNPAFVALQPHVELHMEDLKVPAPPAPAPAAVAGGVAAAAPAAAAAVAAEAKVHPHRVPAADHPRMPVPHLDMDAGVKVNDFEMEDKKLLDIQKEMREWFLDEKEGGLSWSVKPENAWRKIETTFPLLAMLARRFLAILPTSASSERVWSGLGRIIGPQSTTIDSALATELMYLRYNSQIRAAISPSLPPHGEVDE
jgi:hypothetical protein